VAAYLTTEGLPVHSTLDTLVWWVVTHLLIMLVMCYCCW